MFIAQCLYQHLEKDTNRVLTSEQITYGISEHSGHELVKRIGTLMKQTNRLNPDEPIQIVMQTISEVPTSIWPDDVFTLGVKHLTLEDLKTQRNEILKRFAPHLLKPEAPKQEIKQQPVPVMPVAPTPPAPMETNLFVKFGAIKLEDTPPVVVNSGLVVAEDSDLVPVEACDFSKVLDVSGGPEPITKFESDLGPSKSEPTYSVYQTVCDYLNNDTPVLHDELMVEIPVQIPAMIEATIEISKEETTMTEKSVKDRILEACLGVAFDINDEHSRFEIRKALASHYMIVVCDETNNTEEVVDNYQLVVDYQGIRYTFEKKSGTLFDAKFGVDEGEVE